MYATTIQDIKVPFLADAAYVLSLRENDKGEKIYKFRSLYMDKSGECAISYYDKLTEQQIKEIMINFCYPGEDKSYDEIHPTVWKDYEFMKGNSSEKNPDYTTIYTPNGLDYKTLKIQSMVVAFLRWNPFHHKMRKIWEDNPSLGGEYNGYVAFDAELPLSSMSGASWEDSKSLDHLIDVHGGITYDSEIDTTYPMIPLTAMPDPEKMKTFRCIGFDTLHAGDTRDKWPLERVKEETLSLKKQIEELIVERQ